jgi:superfamily II DNA or RNA helicase
MTKQCVITIEDEVNIKMAGLDLGTRKACVDAVKYFQPGARYSAAFKLGRWDGTKSFCTLGGRTYLNLLDRMLPVITEQGFECELVDNRLQYDIGLGEVEADYHAPKVWPKGHERESQPIILRDYQVELVNTYVENLQCIQQIATGAGKTLLTATLSRIIEPYGRSIVIVPSKSLVEQTEVDYKNLGLDVGVLYGDRKEYDRTHTICTWQSLNVLDKNSKDALDDRQHEIFMQNLICVIVDECHILKADVVTRLMTDTFRHVPIRWGMTGTIPEEDQDKLSLLVSVGPNVGDLFASDLQAKGVLANCHVNVLQTKEVVKYTNYQEELKFLTTDRDRIKWMADMITAISTGGNTLVLCDRLETGRALEQLIEGSAFISGAVKSKDRKAEYDNIAVSDDQTLIATYGVAAVGINVPRLFNLVLIEPGKSFVRVIQSIGRGLRKAEDKDFVQIWDMTSTCKFSAKHLTKRKQFYKQAKYPFSIEKIDRLT